MMNTDPFQLLFESDAEFEMNYVLESSDDDEDTRQHGGSTAKRGPSLDRNLMAQETMLRKMYFDIEPIYDEAMFARRFRVNRCIFDTVLADLIREEPVFRQQIDALGKPGPSPLLKVTIMFRILAYGDCFDRSDKTRGMSESSAHKLFHIFTKRMVEIYEEKFLSLPTQEQVDNYLVQFAY